MLGEGVGRLCKCVLTGVSWPAKGKIIIKWDERLKGPQSCLLWAWVIFLSSLTPFWGAGTWCLLVPVLLQVLGFHIPNLDLVLLGLLIFLQVSTLFVSNFWVLVNAKSLKSCPTLCDPRAHKGFSGHGILQARILEWVVMASSNHLPNSGIEPNSLVSPALAGRFFKFLFVCLFIFYH